MRETLWVARTGDGSRVGVAAAKPHFDKTGYPWGVVAWLDKSAFPDLAPGECRRVVLTLAPKGEDDGC